VALFRDDPTVPLDPPLIRWQAPEARLVAWKAADHRDLTPTRRP
jgi:hypothetical protein